MCNMNAISVWFQQLWQTLIFFSKVGQKTKLRSQGQNYWYKLNGLTARNTNI